MPIPTSYKGMDPAVKRVWSEPVKSLHSGKYCQFNYASNSYCGKGYDTYEEAAAVANRENLRMDTCEAERLAWIAAHPPANVPVVHRTGFAQTGRRKR